ncbi:hypothetical protein HN018_24015 (plasmid) [Lichenicola cladoniae]|uniref:Uncharacterized protein n=1 Tax=Lichenicola cladoniae TaxID=1484109 RepID=A0A6M8HYR9_9PROT|nr:hypothetical protein [Lichenicola cladoniae]NPD68961.1 hypothetical protein [Acetobacteraceae bacterium]QKE93241.1 hypothetical protein HN018_24015 [Lichenicola cladoniae]
MDIQYQMVMDDLARLQADPAALPSQIRIKQGTVQVSDELGLYRLDVSGATGGQFAGPRAERTVGRRRDLRSPGPQAASGHLSCGNAASPLDDPGFLQTKQARASSGKAGKGGSGGDSRSGATRIDLARDVPHDWFHAGGRGAAAEHAVWVAHAGRHWVWVGADGLAGLSRFILLVLFISKLSPGENNGSGAGLMYTGGGR